MISKVVLASHLLMNTVLSGFSSTSGFSFSHICGGEIRPCLNAHSPPLYEVDAPGDQYLETG